MTVGYSTNQADHLARLRRIEGQVRGLHRMVEEEQYCIDVLTQIASVTKALQSVAVRLLDEHLHHCVAHAVESGGPEGAAKITEATQAIQRLLKS
jgi:CsoR family transcriptional regulator, copper-sensing transcriptional repressor